MPRVFLSHRSTDIAIVKEIAAKLHAAGIETWLDAWNIVPGDDFVAEINRGLTDCDAAVIFFSHAAAEGPWIQKEISYLTKAATERGMPVIPMMIDPAAMVPPLLATADRVGIDQVERLVDRLLGRSTAPPVAAPAPRTPLSRFRIRLTTRGDEKARTLHVSAWRGATAVVEDHQTGFAADFQLAFQEFLNLRHAHARDGGARAHALQRDSALRELGKHIGAAMFPEAVDSGLTELLAWATANSEPVELVIEAEAGLLSIPFEAARLRNEEAPALHPLVRFSRRLVRENAPGLEEQAPAAGPFKVLVAVGHPDEEKTPNAVLDYEREVSTILNALERATELKGSEVRWLENGSLEAIGTALREDAYHVIHISGHGGAGKIELEDEEGRAVSVTAADLAKAIQQGARSGHPAPLVFLATCHSGQGAGETASVAQGLLENGVRQVVAMQTSVSDTYATRLAGRFYRELARLHAPLPSQALAVARQSLESERLEAMGRPESAGDLVPEYATPALFQLGEEQPLWNRALPQEPLQARGELRSQGAVPMLEADELIGRRPQVREVIRALESRETAGAQIVAMGGTGKSSLAGRVMKLLAQQGWCVAAVTGRYTLQSVAEAIQQAGITAMDPRRPEDELRFLLHAFLQKVQVLLVLDDFHEMLSGPGGEFQNAMEEQFFQEMLAACGKGRLLLTTRYRARAAGSDLHTLVLGPLSVPEARKLLLRLGALEKESPGLATLMSAIGGHPRMLEFVDAILRGGRGRLRHVTRRIEEQARKLDIDLTEPAGSFGDALAVARQLGAADILLEDLLVGLSPEALRAVRQIAPFPVPVPIGAIPGGVKPQVRREVIGSSLVYGAEAGAGQPLLGMHRWTAELVLERMEEAERNAVLRAAAGVLADEEGGCLRPLEAMRLYVRAGALREGAEVAGLIGGAFEALRHHGAMIGFVDEVLTWLPEEEFVYPAMLSRRGDAKNAFGDGAGSVEDQRRALEIREARVEKEPGRADLQRDLSVSYNRLGGILAAAGDGTQALVYFRKSLALFEKLAAQEPGRADLQRDLSVSYERLGDILAATGDGTQPLAYFRKSLAIREKLAVQEPGRADLQRDLSVSYEKLGGILAATGESAQALAYFRKCLGIREKLAAQDAARADRQRDLSVSYEKLGGILAAAGDGTQALAYFRRCLDIFEKLAAQEPGRADLQRDLSISYNKFGDILAATGDSTQALVYFRKSLDIREKLAAQEPGRADLQRDLSVSYERLGDILAATGYGAQALAYFRKCLDIREKLAAQEPGRADLQRDLSVSYNKLGDILAAAGDSTQALAFFRKSLDIREKLAAQEPGRADLQRDLQISHERMGDSYRNAGEEEDAIRHFSTALAIAEHLAKQEPGRADLQVSLVVPLVRLPSPANLRRALGILESLHAEGRLTVQHQGWIEPLREIVAEADAAAAAGA